jgi:shikimate kinase / 3-dehydroquinate synthase
MLQWDNKNVYFIGFMATGKSRIGQAFAALLKRPFLDTDFLIEKRAGKAIRDIFKDHGEAFFRALEKQIVKEVSQKQNHVIALGGGAILDPESWKNITTSGVTVCLTAPEDLIYERIFRKSTRPLMDHESPEELKAKIKATLAERQPFYQQAQYAFSTSEEHTPQEIALEIFEKLTSPYDRSR